MKAAIERVESDARNNFPEREQARPKVKSEEFATAVIFISFLIFLF